MALETVNVVSVTSKTSKDGSKAYFLLDTGTAKLYVWDQAFANALFAKQGGQAVVDVDRSNPNFPKVTSVHDGAVPAQAPIAPPAPTLSGVPAPGGGGIPAAPDKPFKKDPVGLVFSLRQTSLNAAVAYHVGLLRTKMPSEKAAAKDAVAVTVTAGVFFAHLIRGMGGEIDLPKATIFGEGEPPAQDNPPPTALVPLASPVASDDDIPF